MDLIGPNLLMQGMDTATKEKGREVVGKLRPRAVVVFNNDEYALSLALGFPETLVIARLSPPGRDADDNVHKYVEAGMFVNWRMAALVETARKLGVALPENIAIYVNNEPEPTSATFRWLTAVGELLVERGIKGVLGNWANTWPTVDQLQTWEAREYTRLISSHPGLLWNGCHEYAPHVLQHSPPWYLGQWQKWVKLAQEMEIAPPNNIITEAGWDGETEGIRNAMDEMPDKKDRPKQAGRQAVAAVKKFYLSPYIFALCWFCAGVGQDAKRWRVFDALEFDDFWDVIADAETPSPDPFPADREGELTEEEETAVLRGQYEVDGLDGRVLNVRRNPAGEVVDRLRDGDIVTLTGEIEFVEMDGAMYVWREMVNGFWMADVADLVEVIAETVDKDAVRRQLVLMRERFNLWIDEMMVLVE